MSTAKEERERAVRIEDERDEAMPVRPRTRHP